MFLIVQFLAKVSPFYEAQDLIATIMAITNGRQPQMNDWPRIRAILGDVRVEVAYARHRTFALGRFMDRPMSETMFVFFVILNFFSFS